MAGAASVLEDQSTLSRLDRSLFRLESVFALVSGLAVFALMMMAVISVGGRNFFNAPLPGYVDWIEQAMPLIAFMGVSYTQRLGGHIRMDLFLSFLPANRIWIAEFITTILIFIIMMLLVYGTWHHFLRSFDFAAPLWSRDSSMDIAIPLWPAKLIAPVAFSVLVVRLGLQISGYGRAMVEGNDAPVAVPLMEDAATQAANEAATVSGADTSEHADLSADNQRVG